MTSQAVFFMVFVFLCSMLSACEARFLPLSANLHRRFTFVAQVPPEGWATDSLEDYDAYHFRFLSIGCHRQKVSDTDFFDRCCHPRLNSVNLAKIPVECHLDPTSIVEAQNYIRKSTDNQGEIVSGFGTPVYVTNGTIKTLKPAEGRSASQPLTQAQLTKVLQAQAQATKMNDQLTPESQSSDIASTTDRAPTEEAAPTPLTTAPISSVTGYSNMSVKHSEKPASVIKVATTFSPTDANVTAATPTKTVPSINQTMIDASDSESAKASQAAASKEAADASTKAAADEAAAKKASDDAAAQQAADRADADKKKADDAATTSVKSVSHASSDDSSATSDDNDQSSAVDSILSGISQVFGQDGSAKGTFFYQGGAAGACGTVNADSTPLVALPTSLYADGKHCGKQVMIKNTANGKSVVAKVQDMCPGCPSDTSLDLSTGAYDAIGAQSAGVLPIEWGFM